MCGRFTLSAPAEWLIEEFGWLGPSFELTPCYNIAPGQDVLAITNDAVPQARLLRWGLIPSWAKDESIGYKTINARLETLASKPAFRDAYRLRRCLIPADGFYEWRRLGDARVPMHIRRVDQRPFAFAGLWERWTAGANGPVESCSIITREPNGLMAPIHDRMPAIVCAADYTRWLANAPQPAEALAQMLGPVTEDGYEAFTVGRQVNSPAFDGPECIVEVAAPPEQQSLF